VKVSEFNKETLRLMEEADAMDHGLFHGPLTRVAILLMPMYNGEEDYRRPSNMVAETRAAEHHERFKTTWLQDCDPSYNINDNYDPPENIYDCTRTVDLIDGDWYERHFCPKYADQQRDHTTLPPLV